MDLNRGLPAFESMERYIADKGIEPECPFLERGDCATTRLLMGVCATPFHADIILPLVRRVREWQREMERAPHLISIERRTEISMLSLKATLALTLAWPGLYYQGQEEGSARAARQKEDGLWTCALSNWQIAAGYGRDHKDQGDMVFVHHPHGKRFLVVGGFEGACPTQELLVRHRSRVLYCMLRYMGLEPEFVAFHCFRDDVHVGVGGSIYQPIDAQDLCSPSLTPEAADRMLREAACSLQRHPDAPCVSSHDIPTSPQLYGAVHAGNFRPALSDRAMAAMDRVIGSNPEFAACVERRRAACGMTRAQLARLVRGRDRPEKEDVALIREEVMRAEVARRAAALVARGARRAQGERKEAEASSVSRQPGAAKAAVAAPAHSSSPERSRGKGKGPEERRCARCGQTADEAGVEKLRRCGNCRIPCYCSKECQKAEWPAHKEACKKAVAAAAADGAGAGGKKKEEPAKKK